MSFTRRLIYPVLACAAVTTAGATVAKVAERAEKREPLSIVFLGGSLTWGANASEPNTTSYRGRMMRWLREQYPHTPFTFHDAAIGGTGSDLALFRLERDVLARQPDLVFLDFTVNDDISTDDPIRMASYERLVRELRGAGVAVLPVLMGVKGAIIAPDSAPVPARYRAHQKLAEYYGLVAADTLQTARAALAAGRVTADVLYPFPGDPTHPDDPGYELFFEAARDAWLKAAASEAPAPVPDRPLHPDLFPRQERRVLVGAKLPAGWTRQPTYRTAMWFDGLSSRWMADVACAGPGAAPLETTFRGSFVGLFGERNPLTVPFRVWIDGEPVSQPNSKAADPYLWNISTAGFATPSTGAGNLFAWTVLARDLKDGEHTLKIVPDFSGAAPGADLRFESLCSAGQ
jgi:lysophospholipase L1-like esterase